MHWLVCVYNSNNSNSHDVFTDTGAPELDGQLRLVDKISPTSGRLEILKDGLWGTVCSYHFDNEDADVACRQLGYNRTAQVLRKLVLITIVQYIQNH